MTIGQASGREPVNGWLHLGGAVLAAVGLVALLDVAVDRGTVRHPVGAAVFGATALLMFGASALYHLSPRSPRAPLYRRLDHAMIYMFIAGTYTPICLAALWHTPLGRPMLVGVWTLAALGVAQKVAWRDAPRLLSTALYLGLGWLSVIAAPLLLRTSPTLFWWLAAGGLLYTVGAIVYAARWPRGRPGVFGFHELWHVFVLAASAAHYRAVLGYVAASG